MKKLLIITALSLSSTCYAQEAKTKEAPPAPKAEVAKIAIPKESIKQDSILVVAPTAFQLEQIQHLEQQITSLQAQLQNTVLLIVGVRKEDISSLEIKNGAWHVKLKTKPQ